LTLSYGLGADVVVLGVVVLVVVDSAGVTVDVLKYSLAVSVSQMPSKRQSLA